MSRGFQENDWSLRETTHSLVSVNSFSLKSHDWIKCVFVFPGLLVANTSVRYVPLCFSIIKTWGLISRKNMAILTYTLINTKNLKPKQNTFCVKSVLRKSNVIFHQCKLSFRNLISIDTTAHLPSLLRCFHEKKLNHVAKIFTVRENFCNFHTIVPQ